MKITIDLENLSRLLQDNIEADLENVIRQEVKSKIEHMVKEYEKGIIEKVVNEELTNYVRDYIKTTTISVGGGWDSEPKKYTADEYIKKEIADIMSEGKLRTNDRYNPKVTFEDFIKKELDINKHIQAELKNFITKFKKDVDLNIAETFDRTTQEALSASVVNLLLKSETFLDMKDNIKRLTDGR